MIEPLETDICKLIPLHDEHKSDYIALANHPLIRDRVNNTIPYGKPQFDELLGMMQRNPCHLTWAIEVDGMICGAVASRAETDGQRFQGGYWIHPDYWGRGIATAAVKCCNQFIWQTFADAARIQALVEPENAASIRILEKAGYAREGLLKKFYPSRYRGMLDVFMYAIVKSS